MRKIEIKISEKDLVKNLKLYEETRPQRKAFDKSIENIIKNNN
jgi:hypothetical protein